MGPSENPTSPLRNQAASGTRQRRRITRRPGTRRCLLKGCEKRYRPQRAVQRYCSPECREAARAWSRWRAQGRYRATPTGKERRKAQSRRYRERVRSRPKQVLETTKASARVITTEFFRGLLRPAGRAVTKNSCAAGGRRCDGSARRSAGGLGSASGSESGAGRRLARDHTDAKPAPGRRMGQRMRGLVSNLRR